MQKSLKIEQNTAPDVIRTALYIRVSTEEQAMHGLSLEAQQAALEKWARDNKCKIVGTYIDSGKTARKSLKSRTELMRLLNDVEAGKIDLIIFTKLDRWFRNIKDYYKVQDVLEKHHCNWKTIFENYDTSTANGRLHINIMLSIAQDEADRTSERIKAVFADKIRRGEATHPNLPIGYKLVNSKIEIDPERAPIAVDLFNHYRLHQSQRAAGKAMIDLHNVHLHPYTVKMMLTNPIYIGEYHGIKGFCKPLVSEDLFNAVQMIIKNRNVKATPSKYTFIFSGLLVCAECGCHMSGNAQMRTYAGNIKRYYVCYRCNRYVSNGVCNHNRCVGEMKVENFLLENIAPEIEKYMCEFDAKQKKKKPPKVNKTEIRRKLDRLKDLYINDLIDLETYKKDYTELNEKLLTVEMPKPKRDFTPFMQFLKEDFKEMYARLDNADKRALWREIIKQIEIDKDNNMRIVFL